MKKLVPLACSLLLLAQPIPAALAAASDVAYTQPSAPEMPLSISPQAANWKPAVIKSVDALMPPAPPAPKSDQGKAEMKELLAWQGRRSAEDLKAIAYWNEVPSPMRWSEEVRAEIITASIVPPRAARMLALVHAAMYDATVVTWKAKARYRRALPVQVNPFLKAVAGQPGIPSYPSEHAAIAMAAAVTMAELFPDHRDQIMNKARLVGETRVAAGAAFRSDVDAGFKIGEAVARQVLAARANDGAEKPNPPLAKQPGRWWVENPMESGAGRWGTWLMKNGHQFRMSYDWRLKPGNPVFKQAYSEVEVTHRKLSAYQIERAIFWNFDVPALLWNDIARRAVANGRTPMKPDSMGIMWSDIARRSVAEKGLDTPHTAQMLNVLHMTLADAFIACWDTKYANLVPRPYMVSGSTPLKTVVPTPPHPSWPSGHATASMAASVVLSEYFPSQRKYFEAQAREAAMSRLWGGIHFRKDNDDGLKLGVKIGQYSLQQAKARGLMKP